MVLQVSLHLALFIQLTLKLLSNDFDCGDWLLYVVSIPKHREEWNETHVTIAFFPHASQMNSPRSGLGRGVVHGRVRRTSPHSYSELQ
jgi:hypothetical protein